QSGLAATRWPDESGHCARRNRETDFVQDLMMAVSKTKIADIDERRRRSGHGRREISVIIGRWREVWHLDYFYHDKRLRLRSRNTIEVAAIRITRTRKTKAAPYCTRSVYSFCGIFELTT